ncbi:MAG: hypothetical protein QME52_06970 [Bacteroidota bacterium]|nr:hypothetical protein [Bacteroidota bacterium]
MRLIIFLTLFVNLLNDGDTHQRNTKTNVEVMQSLIARISDKVLTNSNISAQESIYIRYPATEDAWIAKTIITSRLISAGYKVFDYDSINSKFLYDIGSLSLRVQYFDMFRDGFFGEKRLTRSIGVSLAVELKNSLTNEILFNGLLNEEMSDTVSVDEIESLELAGVKRSRADIPNNDIIDQIVEPFVIIGAVGISVYLFYYIRTK